MSLSHYWQYVLNSEGQPVSGAHVHLETEPDGDIVSLYTKQGTITTYTTSDPYGFFEFWLGDTDEVYGYHTNATYTLVISGGSLEPRVIEGIQFLFKPPRLFEIAMDFDLVEDPLGTYTRTINHKLNTYYPIVQAYNTNTKQSIIVTCECVDENYAKVTVSGFDIDQSSVPVRIILLGKDS